MIKKNNHSFSHNDIPLKSMQKLQINSFCILFIYIFFLFKKKSLVTITRNFSVTTLQWVTLWNSESRRVRDESYNKMTKIIYCLSQNFSMCDPSIPLLFDFQKKSPPKSMKKKMVHSTSIKRRTYFQCCRKKIFFFRKNISYVHLRFFFL